MSSGNDSRVWIVIGALGGLALGFMLIPLRSLTSASNLAFVFMAFTIVVAELGGRSAAIVTAIVSAFTLNFFLTEPYMSLQIHKADDVVAFGALAVCGLIAAAYCDGRGWRGRLLPGRDGRPSPGCKDPDPDQEPAEDLDDVDRLAEQDDGADCGGERLQIRGERGSRCADPVE